MRAERAQPGQDGPAGVGVGGVGEQPGLHHRGQAQGLDLVRELPWLGGKVVELGRQLGVPTPTHAFMYAALKPYVMGTPT